MRRFIAVFGGGALLSVLMASPVFAHVKWFVETEEIVAKETIHFSLTDPFIMMWIAVIVLTLVVVFLLDIVLPEPKAKFLKKLETWKTLVYRIFAITIGVNFLLESYLGAVFAPPFKVAEFDIMYNEGISKVGDILDIAVDNDIVDKRGSYYSYGETRLAQGRENAKNYLVENPDLALEIENKIRAKFMLPLQDAPVKEPDGAVKETVE